MGSCFLLRLLLLCVCSICHVDIRLFETEYDRVDGIRWNHGFATNGLVILMLLTNLIARTTLSMHA